MVEKAKGRIMREFDVYHRNSPARAVVMLKEWAESPEGAMRQSLDYARRWNWTETRPNMIVKYLECQGVKMNVSTGQIESEVK